MQDLRLIGVHEDGEHLLLSDADGGRFRVRVDEPLRAAVRHDRPAARPAAGRGRRRHAPPRRPGPDPGRLLRRGGRRALRLVGGEGAPLRGSDRRRARARGRAVPWRPRARPRSVAARTHPVGPGRRAARGPWRRPRRRALGRLARGGRPLDGRGDVRRRWPPAAGLAGTSTSPTAPSPPSTTRPAGSARRSSRHARPDPRAPPRPRPRPHDHRLRRRGRGRRARRPAPDHARTGSHGDSAEAADVARRVAARSRWT